MIMGSNGASNSKDLTWFNQLIGLRAKIFPYFEFYGLLRKSSGKLSFGGTVEVLTWIMELHLSHMKGLMRLVIGKILRWD
jgi:hypothetical protein